MDPVRCHLGLMKLFLGKLLSLMKTVVLHLLLRCPNYSTGSLAPCWLTPTQYKNSMTGAHL